MATKEQLKEIRELRDRYVDLVCDLQIPRPDRGPVTTTERQRQAAAEEEVKQMIIDLMSAFEQTDLGDRLVRTLRAFEGRSK